MGLSGRRPRSCNLFVALNNKFKEFVPLLKSSHNPSVMACEQSIPAVPSLLHKSPLLEGAGITRLIIFSSGFWIKNLLNLTGSIKRVLY